jgi:hypothetical protein
MVYIDWDYYILVMIMCLLEIILSMLKFSKKNKNLVLKVEDSKQLIILQTFAEFVWGLQ